MNDAYYNQGNDTLNMLNDLRAMQLEEEYRPAKYRIQNSDGTILNAGTDNESWFNLDNARKTVNYETGQRIIESDGVNILWEVI